MGIEAGTRTDKVPPYTQALRQHFQKTQCSFIKFNFMHLLLMTVSSLFQLNYILIDVFYYIVVNNYIILYYSRECVT